MTTIVVDNKISLTGNPFVDNGLAVIAALADCKTMNELTLEKIREVHKKGERLARANNILSSTFSLYLNSPLTNQKKGKDNTPLLKNYAKMTTTILDGIGKETINEYCDFCGNPKSTDLVGHMGRHWFPLSGSMGSDAQALPAA